MTVYLRIARFLYRILVVASLIPYTVINATKLRLGFPLVKGGIPRSGKGISGCPTCLGVARSAKTEGGNPGRRVSLDARENGHDRVCDNQEVIQAFNLNTVLILSFWTAFGPEGRMEARQQRRGGFVFPLRLVPCALHLLPTPLNSMFKFSRRGA